MIDWTVVTRRRFKSREEFTEFLDDMRAMRVYPKDIQNALYHYKDAPVVWHNTGEGGEAVTTTFTIEELQ